MNSSRIFLLLLGDTLCFIGALILMLAVDTQGPIKPDILSSFFIAFSIPFLLALLSFYLTDLYDIRRSIPTPRTIGRFVLAAALFGGLAALFFYLFPGFGITPKLNLAIIAGSLLVFMIVWRRLFFFLFARTFARTILFIGEDKEIHELERALVEHSHIGKSVGTLTTILQYNPEVHIADLIVISREVGTRDVEGVSKIQTPIMTVRTAFEEMFGKTPLSLLSQEEVFTLLEQKTRHNEHIMYRIFEVFVGVFILIITSPFLLLSALAILIESGRPILYTHTRTGKNGTPFEIYKLRSMIKNSEKEGAQWAEKKDSRVTAVGRIIRKTHIDEIPQMWNLIKGDIALVGPRPERPEFVATLEKEIPYYAIRHNIKPGFTGWAQVRYRYARTVDDSREKFEYDLYYIKNKSLILDIGILAKTVQIIFTHD